jgi:hypothetical protein
MTDYDDDMTEAEWCAERDAAQGESVIRQMRRRIVKLEESVAELVAKLPRCDAITDRSPGIVDTCGAVAMWNVPTGRPNPGWYSCDAHRGRAYRVAELPWAPALRALLQQESTLDLTAPRDAHGNK